MNFRSMSLGSNFVRFTLVFFVVLVILLLALAKKVNAQEIMPLSEIKKGDRGYGLTVFEGDKPEKFDFEVLGIFDNGTNYYIFVELSGGPKDKNGVEILKKTRILSGMSGSPMYTSDGKIIGGLAMAPRFAIDSKAYITPAEYMVGLKPKLLYQPNGLIYGNYAFNNFWNLWKFSMPLIEPVALSSIVPGDAYAFCEYWGDDFACSAGTVTLADKNDPSMFYTLGHSSGPVGRRALPFWKAEVLSNIARVDSSNKVVRKAGPMLGAVIFNEPFNQVIKVGVMPRFIPMRVVVENYFIEPRVLNYFFAYTDTVGHNISSVILNQKKNVANSLDIDAEIRIDIAGQPQAYSRGYLGQTTTAGMVVNEFISDGMAPIIERVNVVLSARPKYKSFELSNLKPTISKNKDGNLSVSFTLTAGLGPNRWEKAINLEVNKKYEGKNLYLSNGEAAAEDVLTNLGDSSSSIGWLNQVSDRNALYLYFADTSAPSLAAAEFFLSLGELSTSERVQGDGKLTKASVALPTNAKPSSHIVEPKSTTSWQLNSKPQDHFDLLAKIELPGSDILITGKKDFVLTSAVGANVLAAPKKKRGFLPFFSKF